MTISLSWESIGTPAGLGAMVGVLMVVLFKPVIQLVMEARWYAHHTDPAPEPWQLRSLIVNAVSLVFCLVLAGWWVAPAGREAWGQTFVLAINAWVFGTGEYEVLKNLLGTVGVDLQNVGLLTTSIGSRY